MNVNGEHLHSCKAMDTNKVITQTKHDTLMFVILINRHGNSFSWFR